MLVQLHFVLRQLFGVKSGVVTCLNFSARPKWLLTDKIKSIDPFGGFLWCCSGSKSIIFFCIDRSTFLSFKCSACRAAAFLSSSILRTFSCFSLCLAETRIPARVGDFVFGWSVFLGFGGMKSFSTMLASVSRVLASICFTLSRWASSHSAVGNRYFCDVVILIKALIVGCTFQSSAPTSFGERPLNTSAMHETRHHKLVTAKRGRLEAFKSQEIRFSCLSSSSEGN